MHLFPRVPFCALALVGALAVPAAAQPDTQLDLRGLKAELPGRWAKHPSARNNIWIYRSADTKDQLTIRTQAAPKYLSTLECRDAAARVVAHRQKAERKRLGADTKFQATSSADHAGVFVVGYYGEAPKEPRWFATYIACTRRGIWTFFHETRHESQLWLMKRVGFITATLEAVDLSGGGSKKDEDGGKNGGDQGKGGKSKKSKPPTKPVKPQSK